jgi:hypothetical protein
MTAKYLLSYTREVCGITDHLTPAAAFKNDPVAFEAALKEMQAVFEKARAAQTQMRMFNNGEK